MNISTPSLMNSVTLITLALTLHLITLASSQPSSCRPGTFFNGVRCRPCRAGTYQDETGATSCKKCPLGTYNEFRGMRGIDLCLPCPAGTFFDERGSPSLSECKPCPTGLSSLPGSRSCARCEPGQFLFPRRNRVELNNRVPVCRGCPANQVSSTPNAQSCEQCPVPFVNNPSSTSCITCRPGFGPVLSRGSVTCERCSLFRVSDGAEPCQRCPRGFVNSEFFEGTTCRPCPEGTTSNSNGQFCTRCGPGENRGARGMPFCLPADTPCPENYFFNNNNACQTCSKSERYDENLKTCVRCGRNLESRGGIDKRCRSCGRNREGGNNGCVCKPGLGVLRDGTCFRCQLGMIWDGTICDSCKGPFEVVRPGELTCRECPPGTVPNSIRTGCDRCPRNARPSSRIGFFEEKTVAVCVDVTTGCPPGSSRLLSADGNLVRCSPNSCPPELDERIRTTRASDPIPFVGRLRECFMCPDGTFLTANGCQQCPEDEYSKGTRRCQRCPDGLKRGNLFRLDPKPSAGSRCGCFSDGRSKGFINRRCELCPRGTFGDPRGERGCRRCPPGLVSTRPGRTECSTCQRGFIADDNRRGCQPCPSGTTSFGVGEISCVRIGSLR